MHSNRLYRNGQSKVHLSFSGKKVLITGGTSGIGYATAKLFLDFEATVWVTGQSGKTYGPKDSHCIHANFKDSDNVKSLLNEVAHIQPDVLINNAAAYTPSTFETSTVDDARTVHEVSYMTPFQLIKTCLPSMQKNNWGRIINIGTLWTELTPQNRSAYTSSKIALIGLTRNISSDYAKYNILCNMVSPGFTATSWVDGIDVEKRKSIESKIPLARLAEPLEIAKTIVFLCSEDNSYITGQNLLVDGGFTKSHIF